MSRRMRREPWFWREQSPTARALSTLLTPAAYLYQAGHQLRWAMTTPKQAPLPVICVGNATLGGVGKTPFAILAASLLREAGAAPAFLTRGYGGALGGPVLVDPAQHDAYDVGDEALLLARHGPVVVSHDRPAGANLAAQTGADILIMDDGFQNPSLAKDMSILLVGESSHNHALFPAGPYREALSDAKARADLVIAMRDEPGEAPDADLSAWLEATDAPAPETVIAFAGIGRPEKFFLTLERQGFKLARRVAFPDHHPYTEIELTQLAREAARKNARLITTEKDHIRVPPAFREEVMTLPVALQVSSRETLKQRLAGLITKPMQPSGAL